MILFSGLMLLSSGTPPRLDGRTINYQGLEEQRGDDPPSPFSFLHHTVPYAVSKQRSRISQLLF